MVSTERNVFLLRARKGSKINGVQQQEGRHDTFRCVSDAEDPYNLTRFVDAQAANYAHAPTEMKSGKKRTHWMWYVFLQLDGLACSTTSQRYAIKSIEEAEACLAHPLLGPRLHECVEAVLQIEGRSMTEVFGSPDDLKLRSCATLFACVSPPGSVFDRLLTQYYGGERDKNTLRLLRLASDGR